RQVSGLNGAVTIEEVYPLKIELANKHGGTVLVADCVYGDTDDQGVPHCADLKTGEIKSEKRRSVSGSASMISADGYPHILHGRIARSTRLVWFRSPERRSLVAAVGT